MLTGMAPAVTAWSLSRPLDLILTLGPLQRSGRRDPCVRVERGLAWRITRTPAGPATQRIQLEAGRVTVTAWGPGAEAAIAGARELVGEGDDWSGFAPAHPLLAEARRRLRGLRLTRSKAVLEALTPAILEQKVPGIEARIAHARLVRTLGEPPPPAPQMPLGMMVPPVPSRLANTPYEAFHVFGVDRKRAETVRRAASYANRLEECSEMEPAAARARIMALPGLGPWTAGEVTAVALGDPDAVPVGDYHLPHLVSFALAGEPRGSDDRMLELLEPYRGHRQRVLRLLLGIGINAPRRGPRLALNPRLGFR